MLMTIDTSLLQSSVELLYKFYIISLTRCLSIDVFTGSNWLKVDISPMVVYSIIITALTSSKDPIHIYLYKGGVLAGMLFCVKKMSNCYFYKRSFLITLFHFSTTGTCGNFTVNGTHDQGFYCDSVVAADSVMLNVTNSVLSLLQVVNSQHFSLLYLPFRSSMIVGAYNYIIYIIHFAHKTNVHQVWNIQVVGYGGSNLSELHALRH